MTEKTLKKIIATLIITSVLFAGLVLFEERRSDAPKANEETKSTIIVEEKETFASVLGIENASVSPFNKLTNFEEFERKLAEKQQAEQVTNAEVTIGGTVYVDNEYYEQNDEEPPYINMDDVQTTPTQEPTQETEDNTNNNTEYINMGVFDITAYTWTGNPMANGEYPYEGCVASCDFAIGTVLYIDGLGTYVVKDVCPTSGVVDIYMDSYNACIQFGRQYRNVYIVN